MARPSPSARVDSKNTVSPVAIAVTIESASSPRAPVDAAANAPTPAVAVTQPSRSAPPTVARAALTTTEPSPGTSERARRPFTAQVSAEPSAASAPRVDSAITPQIVRYPPALTPFARPCYSLATVRKETHDVRPLGPLPSAAPPDDGRGRRRRGRRPPVVGGAPSPPRPGVGGYAGIISVQLPRHQRRRLLAHRPRQGVRHHAPQGGLDVGGVPGRRQGVHEARQEPVRVRHARPGHLGDPLRHGVHVRQRRPGPEGRQGGRQLEGGGRRPRVVPRPLPQGQGLPAERAHRRLAGYRRGVRPRRHQHVHPQLRLVGGAEGFRGRAELRHPPAADRPGEEAHVVLFLRDAHRVQEWKEPRGGVALHGVAHGRRAELHVLQDPRPPAGAQDPRRPAGVRQGPGLRGLHQILPVLDREPVPGPRRVGRQARLRGRAALPAGAGRQAHGPGVPGQVRRRARQEHDLMAPSDATVAVALPRSLSSRRARELMTGYLYLVPVAIALGGTIVVPILKAMHMSLFNYVLIKPQEYGFVGLGNYTRLLRDETFWLTLWNSFVWLYESVSLQFLGGFAAALLLHQSFRGRAVVRTVTLLPWIVPGVVVALVSDWLSP